MKITIVIAMLCITALEVTAIANSIDGAALGLVVAAIAGLGGYEAKIWRDKRKGGR